MTREYKDRSSTTTMRGAHGTRRVLVAGLTILAALLLVLTMAVRPVAFAADAQAGSAGTIQRTNGLAPGQIGANGSATVLVYMNGSDLESEAGEATGDIAEMIDSGIGDNANVVIETVGTKEWQDYGIASDHTQRWAVEKGELKLVDDSLGQLDTTDPDTLADFISWGTANYPADRYILVFWDHGAGPVYGFGYDEFQSEESALTLDEMKQAFDANPGVHFDIIGMDCCIMGSLETCLALQPYCDYTIVSEDFEPGIGWSYEGWMGMLEQNPGTDTVELGKVIVDDMIADVAADEENGEATLALIDESAVGELYTAWVSFAQANEDQLLGTNYSQETEWRDRPGSEERAHGEHDAYGNDGSNGALSDLINAIGYGAEEAYGYCEDCEGYEDYSCSCDECMCGSDWDSLWADWDYDGSYVTMTDYFVTDIMEVASSVESTEATSLESAFKNAMVHYNSTSGEVGMSGLGVTLPYGDGEFYDQMVKVFTACGIDSDYVKWLEAFVDAEGVNNYYSADDYGYDAYGYEGYGSDSNDMYGYENYGYGYGSGSGHSNHGYSDDDYYGYDAYGYDDGYDYDDGYGYGYGSGSGSDSASGQSGHSSNVGKPEWSSSQSAQTSGHHHGF